jgi:isoamylase
LGRSRFWREDIHWYGVGTEVDRSLWSQSLAFCLHGSSQQDTDLYVMVNAYKEDLHFTIQEGRASDWLRVLDTSLRVPEGFAEPGREIRLQTLDYPAKARSIVILIRQ